MDLKTAKAIIFQAVPDADDYWETAEALRDLDRQYQHFTRTVWKASKQLLKFDEINRLVATEVEETAPKASSSRSSGGSGSKASGTKTTTAGTKAAGAELPKAEASLPLYFAIKDVLFNWSDLNWESVMMKLLAGLFAVSGGVIGYMLGGLPGAVIDLGVGLLLGLLADSIIFDFDGKLSADEVRDSVLALLPALGGGLLGFVAGGPLGAAIGLVLGTALSFRLLGFDWSDIRSKLEEFFSDLSLNWNRRWGSFTALVQGLWSQLKGWWGGLSLGRFPFRLPHLTVSWQALSADSLLARYLGISAIPHLGVEWYARGGIVDGATLIGAGEQGKEAIVPLERHTEWIRMVAVQLREELQKLSPAAPATLRMIPAAASSLAPYAATLRLPDASQPDLSGLAATLAQAISALGDRPQPDAEIRVYLDGKQLSDAVTRYQRRAARTQGA